MNTIEHNYTALDKVVASQALEPALPKILQQLQKHRVFILSFNTLSQKTTVVKHMIEFLGLACVDLFDRCRQSCS